MPHREQGGARHQKLEEDQLLREAVGRLGEGSTWKAIAELVPGRDDKACFRRWRYILSPDAEKGTGGWTVDEDALLLAGVDEHGTKWSKIAKTLQGRTGESVLKRYKSKAFQSWAKQEPVCERLACACT